MLAALARLTVLVVLAASTLRAQSNSVNAGASLPATCTVGAAYITTSTPTMSVCSSPNTWTVVPIGGGGTAIPAGLVAMVLAGTCPSTWTEVAALNGKMIRGTVAANGNVGTTGGSDTYTPSGGVSAPTVTWPASVPTFLGTATAVPAHTISWPASVPTFLGTALATHAHELPWQVATTTTIRQIAVATFGTGTSRAATAVSAAGTANTTSAAVALSQAVSAGTPSGTISWPASVPTMGTVNFTPTGSLTWPAAVPTNSTPGFVGAPATVIPAYVNAIFCSKQ